MTDTLTLWSNFLCERKFVGTLALALIAIAVLGAVATATASVSAQNDVYFDPQDVNIPQGTGHNITVDLRVNATQTINSWQTNISFNPNCINITNVTFYSPWNTVSPWTWSAGEIKIGNAKLPPCLSGDMLLATLTLHCEDCCQSPLDFTGTHLLWCAGNKRTASWTNGTVACGEVENETTTPTPTPTPTPVHSSDSGSGSGSAPTSTPTPTPTPTASISSSPSPTPITPASPPAPPLPTETETKTKTKTENESKVTHASTPATTTGMVTPEPERKIPGFESLFACFALLIAPLFLKRKKKEGKNERKWENKK